MKQFMTLMALLSLATMGWAGTSREATTDRMDHAGQIQHEIMAASDNGIPEEVLEHAKCVAVVHNLLKGGFVFGAENGRGMPPAGQLKDGAHRPSLQSPAVAGACRSAYWIFVPHGHGGEN